MTEVDEDRGSPNVTDYHTKGAPNTSTHSSSLRYPDFRSTPLHGSPEPSTQELPDPGWHGCPDRRAV